MYVNLEEIMNAPILISLSYRCNRLKKASPIMCFVSPVYTKVTVWFWVGVSGTSTQYRAYSINGTFGSAVDSWQELYKTHINVNVNCWSVFTYYNMRKLSCPVATTWQPTDKP